MLELGHLWHTARSMFRADFSNSFTSGGFMSRQGDVRASEN